MLTHRQIWKAIDSLAHLYNLSTSGLAKQAGLDPTTFNKSKRILPTGKERWPSMESIAKILEATDTNFEDFTLLVTGHAVATPRETQAMPIPVIGFAQAGTGGYFGDGGFPVGAGWDHVSFPDVGDENAYALEVSGDSMEPFYRAGDIIVVSPAAEVRRGDRVVVKTREGEVLAKQLIRKTVSKIELHSWNSSHPDLTFSLEEVDWMARIVWASQ